jgi:hypothetical protein
MPAPHLRSPGTTTPKRSSTSGTAAATGEHVDRSLAELERDTGWNTADRVARQALRSAMSGGFEQAGELFAPGFASEDRKHRSLPHATTGEALDASIHQLREVGWSTTDIETIAVRGDHLCLQRWGIAGDEGGWASDQLMLSEVDDDGRVSVGIGYNVEQLAEAQIELDRRHFDSLGFAQDHPMRKLSAAGHSVDPDALLSLAHPEIVYLEHRRLPFAVGGTRSELATDNETMILIDHVINAVSHRISETATLIHRKEVTPDGYVTSFLVVGTLRDGLFATYDVYDPEDLDAAISCYDELTADLDLDPLVNSSDG